MQIRELGYILFDATGSDHLFQLVAKVYEHRSLIVTTNLDRLLHQALVVLLIGDSYRISYRLTPQHPASKKHYET